MTVGTEFWVVDGIGSGLGCDQFMFFSHDNLMIPMCSLDCVLCCWPRMPCLVQTPTGCIMNDCPVSLIWAGMMYRGT